VAEVSNSQCEILRSLVILGLMNYWEFGITLKFQTLNEDFDDIFFENGGKSKSSIINVTKIWDEVLTKQAREKLNSQVWAEQVWLGIISINKNRES